MRLNELAEKLYKLYQEHGNLEVVIDVVSQSQVFYIGEVVEYDRFEPDHEGYFVIETAGEEIP